MAAGKRIHDRKMTEKSHAKCYLVSKAHKTEFQLVLGVHLFNGSNIYVTIGDAITPEINMATEKRKQQLELHNS